MTNLFRNPHKVKIPPPPAAPPTPTSEEGDIAAGDVKARRRRAKGRRASLATTPGALAVSDVNILRPELKEKLG